MATTLFKSVRIILFIHAGILGLAKGDCEGTAPGTVSSSCSNGICQAKICDGTKCYETEANAIKTMQIAGCPVVICPAECYDFRMLNACPVCRCQGYGVGQVCNADSDCPSGLCDNNLCKLTILADSLPLVCTSSVDCPVSEKCDKSMCVVVASGLKHLVGNEGSCVSNADYQCPSMYECIDRTCWEGGVDHIEDKICLLDIECPAGYECLDKTCFKKINGGSSSTVERCIADRDCASKFSCVGGTCFHGGPDHIQGKLCLFDSMCTTGYICTNQTCYAGERANDDISCVWDLSCPTGYKCKGFKCVQ